MMNRMQSSWNFFISIGAVILQMLLSLMFIKIIFGYVGDISGWSYYQSLVIVGTYMLVEGLMWSNTAYLAGLDMHIRNGTLDGIILKPIDTQFFVSFWRGDLEDISRIISGMGILVYALINLHLGAVQVFLGMISYSILLLCALIIIYSLVVFIKSISFWSIMGHGFFRLVTMLTKISQYPTTIFYHKIVQITFTFVIPLAFVATIPAKGLIGELSWWILGEACLIAGIFFWGSRKFFQFALRHYSSASS
jgi:ABC-2 type transport system permease protein